LTATGLHGKVVSRDLHLENDMNGALLLLRLVFGLAMAAHGAQKLFGWFGGGGLTGTGAFFESIGFRPGVPFALMAGLTEFSSGLLLALGFLGPIGPALIVSVMLVAMRTVNKGHGFFAQTGGVELSVLYVTGAVAVACAGPGAYSLDHLLGLEALFPRVATVIIFAVAVAGALGNLAVRKSESVAGR
jgi:putative oxidoreductase